MNLNKSITNDGEAMELTLSIDRQELGKAMLSLIAEKIYNMDVRGSITANIRHDVKEITREVVYAHKEEIIEEVVKRATKEVVRKSIIAMIDKEEG